jgi:replication factor C subunit 3/5
MDSDEDTQMADVEQMPVSAFAKGKGKAVDHDHPYDNENLPW